MEEEDVKQISKNNGNSNSDSNNNINNNSINNNSNNNTSIVRYAIPQRVAEDVLLGGEDLYVKGRRLESRLELDERAGVDVRRDRRDRGVQEEDVLAVVGAPVGRNGEGGDIGGAIRLISAFWRRLRGCVSATDGNVPLIPAHLVLR